MHRTAANLPIIPWLFMLMEYCNGGDLETLLESNRYISPVSSIYHYYHLCQCSPFIIHISNECQFVFHDRYFDETPSLIWAVNLPNERIAYMVWRNVVLNHFESAMTHYWIILIVMSHLLFIPRSDHLVRSDVSSPSLHLRNFSFFQCLHYVFLPGSFSLISQMGSTIFIILGYFIAICNFIINWNS